MPEIDAEPDAVDVRDFENQVETITDATAAYVTSSTDVWAVVTCMDEYEEVLALAVSLPGVVVHKADRSENKVSLAMESHADEL